MSTKIVLLNPYTSMPQRHVRVEARSIATGKSLGLANTNDFGVAEFNLAEEASFHARTSNTPPLYQIVHYPAGLGPFEYDYLVDANWAAKVAAGEGTEGQEFETFHGHTFKLYSTLFGASGALDNAIATTADRTIFVVSSHTESLAAAYDLRPLAVNQRVYVLSAGRTRPSFTVHADLSTNPVLTQDADSCGAGSLLRFEGLAFNRPAAVSVGPFFRPSGGHAIPQIEIYDVTFQGTKWNLLLHFGHGDACISGNVTLDRIWLPDSARAVVYVTSPHQSGGSFVLRNSHFGTLEYIQERNASTAVDVGQNGISVENCVFESITEIAWDRTYNYPFVFADNQIINYGGASACVAIGTAATTSPVDASITGNYIRCTNAAANAVKITGGAGTAENISVVGNSLRGPSASTAIDVDIANTDCLFLNSYRDWTTNVGGSPGPGTTTIPGDLDVDGNLGLAGYIEFGEITAPSNPDDGFGRLYMKNTDHLYWLSTGGIEHDLAIPYWATNKGVYEDVSVVTDGGGLDITWDTCKIWDRANKVLVSITAEASPQACTDNDMNYLKWVSGTTLTLNTTPPSGDEVEVAHILCASGDIVVIHYPSEPWESITDIREAFGSAFPSVVTGGLVIGDDPDGTNDLDVQLSAGGFIHEDFMVVTVGSVIYSRTVNLIRHYHSSSAWTTDTDAEIDPTQYDPGTNLAGVNNAKYYKSAFYTDGTHIHWVYPQVAYDTLAQAIAGALPTPPPIMDHIPSCTAVVMKGNDTDLPAVGERWIDIRPFFGAMAGFGPVSDHGNLAGLGDVDHTWATLKATLTAQGSMYAASGASTPAELAIGAADTILVCDGSDPSWSGSPTLSGTLTLDSGGIVVSPNGEAAIILDGTDWTPVDEMGIGEAGGTLYLQGRNAITFVIDPANSGARNFYWYHGDDLAAGTLIMQLDEAGHLHLPGGGLWLGVDDTTQGHLRLYGSGADAGAAITLYVGANHDAVYDYWQIAIVAGTDDLYWTAAATPRMILTAEGQLQILTGSLSVDTIVEYTGDAGVTIDGVLLKDGVVTVGDVAFDDPTSDPAAAGPTAADGVENSVARKDHVHALGTLGATWVPGTQDIGNYDWTGKMRFGIFGDAHFYAGVGGTIAVLVFETVGGFTKIEVDRATGIMIFTRRNTAYMHIGASGVLLDTIGELTPGAGVTVDGLLIKDGAGGRAADRSLVMAMS